jgi:hypothetical protein
MNVSTQATAAQASTATERVPASRGSIPLRLAAVCGALFPLGILVGDDQINTAGEPPAHDASLAEIKGYLETADGSGGYWLGRGLGTLALAALLVFSAYVAHAIRQRERDHGLLAGIASASGIAAVAVFVVSGSAQFAAVQRGSEGIDLEVARALLDVSGILFKLGFGLVAVFVGSIAVAGLRYDLLPRWLTITAGLLAVGMLGGLAAAPAEAAFGIPLVLTFLWFIAAGIVLAWRPERALSGHPVGLRASATMDR